MQTTEPFAGLSCLDCGADPSTDGGRCLPYERAPAPASDDETLAVARGRQTRTVRPGPAG